MGVWRHRVHLLAITIVIGVALHTQGLELSVTQQLHLPDSDAACGRIKCVAEGKSVTIETVTLTRIKNTGDSKSIFTISKSNPATELHFDNIYYNGTLENNLASIHVYQRNPSSCDSDLFVCNVTSIEKSGQRKATSAILAPGQFLFPSPKSRQDAMVKKTEDTILEIGAVASNTSPNILLSEVWFCNEKINKVEGKFQTLNARLSDQVSRASEAVIKRAGSLESTVLQRVASVESDISTRVSRLEDRLAAILLSHSESATSSDGLSETLGDLEREVEGLKAAVNGVNTSEGARQQSYPRDQPLSCSRGMGDDITKDYAPYSIMAHGSLEKEILCDTHTDGGGWIVIQRRAKGDVDFYQDWTKYREGFGSLTGDFWMGNEAIHKLTDSEPYELRIDMRHNGQAVFAEYSTFRIEDESNKYRLIIGPYTGTAGDGLKVHNNLAFTTFDRDSDVHATLNCAIHEHGAWWYKNCIHSNLNGKWGAKLTPGVSWYTGSAWTLPYFTEMKIRHVKSKGNHW